MISTKIDRFWQISRSLAILAFIIGSVISVTRCHSYTLEIELTGPGSPADRLNESTRDRENREAFDRVNEGSDSRRDVEKAREYERDHSA